VNQILQGYNCEYRFDIMLNKVTLVGIVQKMKYGILVYYIIDKIWLIPVYSSKSIDTKCSFVFYSLGYQGIRVVSECD